MTSRHCRFLSTEDYAGLYRAFRESFSDHGLDMSCLNERNIGDRWAKNGQSYGSSVGTFDGDRMVGFTVAGRAFQDLRASGKEAG